MANVDLYLSVSAMVLGVVVMLAGVVLNCYAARFVEEERLNKSIVVMLVGTAIALIALINLFVKYAHYVDF